MGLTSTKRHSVQNLARLRDLVDRVRRPVPVEADETYSQIGIRSHGKGLFYKEQVTGALLGNKAVFWVEPDCFVVNIVFAWEQAVAKTTSAEVGMIASHRFPMYRPKGGKLDLDYLTYFFKTSYGIHLLNLASPGGAGRNKTLGQQEFLNLEIPCPPFSEQRKIAEILGAWDRAIALTEQLIAAHRRRKKGLMQQLLTGRRRFPEFVWQAWREVHLGEIAVVNPPRPKHVPDDTPVSFLAMADVSEEARIESQSVRLFGDVKNGLTPFQDGDVLVAKITPCFENGKGALVDNLHNGIGFGSTEFHVIRAKADHVLPRFIYYHTIADTFRGRGVSAMVGSAGQKRVQADFLACYRILLPALEEQRALVSVLVACDEEIDLLSRKLATLQQQKKGLMQQLLTGRVRVKI